MGIGDRRDCECVAFRYVVIELASILVPMIGVVW